MGLFDRMFDCLKSERAREIRRITEKKRYGPLLYQCGYDEISSFSEALRVLSGPQEQYYLLTGLIAKDPNGMIAGVLLPHVDMVGGLCLTDNVKQELFVAGIHAAAREHGENEMTYALNVQGFSDPSVIKEIVARRSEGIITKGLEAVAEDVATQISGQDVRASYVKRMTCELDKLIKATQGEALKAVQDQIATAQDYLNILSEKRNELKKPYEERKLRLNEQFDADQATAREHLKTGRVAKAYSLLTALGYDARSYVTSGVNAVQKHRVPSWLFGEILKRVCVDRKALAQYETQAFHRAADQQLAVLVTDGGNVFIHQSPLHHGMLEHTLSRVLIDIQNWTNRDCNLYRDIQQAKRHIIDDALTRPHRD